MGFDFEKLEVYQKSISFSEKVYKICSQFPQAETYGLSGQLKRASVSISSNIAEGMGRYNKGETVQFLRIARGSIYECVPLIEISSRQGYVSKPDHDLILESCNELAKMVNGLINSLEKSR
ncbi:MAG TPA: four helix bundle protein [Candidatus Omnitrophota bacterium]|nr:four helix bundle protein [Candidatus Omnitrophota bacterium]HPT07316.1 four helix bundle protein [Candidatus Omnitrophota bacterium]